MEQETKNGLEVKLEGVVQEQKSLSLAQKTSKFLKNYAIDTSAKIAMWAPYMATWEVAQGWDADKILSVRGTSVLIDTLAARPYGKVLDFTRKKFNADKSALRKYAVDTATMIGYYGSLYGVYMKAYGFDNEKILKAEGIAALAAMAGARVFGMGLNKWRNHFGYQK